MRTEPQRKHIKDMTIAELTDVRTFLATEMDILADNMMAAVKGGPDQLNRYEDCKALHSDLAVKYFKIALELQRRIDLIIFD